MAVDITQQAYQAIQEVVQKILGNRDEAAAYAEDPYGYLTSEGLTDQDLSGCNVQQAILQAAGNTSLPAATWQTVEQTYGDSPPYDPSSGQSQGEYLVQQISQIANITYSDDDYISTQLTNEENYLDNSVHLDGNFAGDVDLDLQNANAIGDGAQAVNVEGDVNAPIVGGDVSGIAAGTIDTDGGDLKFAQGDLLDQENASESVGVTGEVGGDVINAPNAYADDGAALKIGGGDGDNTGNNVENFGGIVATEQGDGDQTQHTDVDVNVQVEGEYEDDYYQRQLLTSSGSDDDSSDSSSYATDGTEA